MIVDAKRLKIEVVTTDLADLSMQGFGSVQNCRFIFEALTEFFPKTRLRVINCADDLNSLASASPDLVVAGIKFVDFSADCGKKTSKNKIWLSEYLENKGIEFTGSRHPAIRLEFDKYRAVRQASDNCLNTAASFIVQPGQYRSAQQLPLPPPLFIKPLYESDSKGIDQMSVARDFDGFDAKVRQIWTEFNEPALAETYLPGREFTVAILEAGNGILPEIMPIEISVEHASDSDHYLAFSTKQANSELLQAIDEPDIERQVNSLAYRAFHAMGARDFGRIDIKMDENGIPCFLEANLLPGMHPEHSYFPLACTACKQMKYAEVARRMVLPAIRRLT